MTCDSLAARNQRRKAEDKNEKDISAGIDSCPIGMRSRYAYCVNSNADDYFKSARFDDHFRVREHGG